MSACPEEATLRMLGGDGLGDATYAAIEQHVENCPDCKLVLEQLAHRRGEAAAGLPGPERLPRLPGFEIQRVLDRGATSVVYLAIERRLNRPVALKVLPGGAGTDESARPRRHWLREAQAISSVRHPNVVPLYDYGDADGWLFLVLEFVPGGSLKQRLVEPLPPRAAAGMMETIVRAVGHLHGHGLIHLDLKPSNILLDGECDGPWDRVIPRITDFGLALLTDGAAASETSLAGIRGTPSYMAPEQAAGSRAEVITGAADIHGLGAILYHMVTGRPPFQGSSTLETLDQVRAQLPVPPRRLNPKIPRDLETIALKCLEKLPSQRYATADAMADDLRRWLDGRPIQARPVSPVEHGWRWCRRQPVIAALTGILFLTLIGSFGVLMVLLRRSETLRARSEANYQVASQSLDELLQVFDSESMRFQAGPPGRYPRLEALEAARLQATRLSRGNPLDARGLRRLAMIDDMLHNYYLREGRVDEAWSVTEESLESWNALVSLAPAEPGPYRRLIGALDQSLSFAGDQKGRDLYERWESQITASIQRLRQVPEVHAAQVCRLNHAHRHRAITLMLSEELPRAERVLEDDLNVLRSVRAAETVAPDFVLSESLTLAALGRWSGELTVSQSPLPLQPALLTANESLNNLAELTARRIGWLPTITTPAWFRGEESTTEAWADRVIASVGSDAKRMNLDHRCVTTIFWLMRVRALPVLHTLRSLGKLDDARRITDQWLALGERLAKLYPNEADSYMFLSEGYVQKAKIAYRVPGEPIVVWEQKALDAALHAARLEPEKDEASGLLEKCRVRLARVPLK